MNTKNLCKNICNDITEGGVLGAAFGSKATDIGLIIFNDRPNNWSYKSFRSFDIDPRKLIRQWL